MVEAYKPIYTVQEVSKILKTNVNTVYDLIHSGQLQSLKLGKRKIRGKDLEAFINNYPVAAALDTEEKEDCNDLQRL